MRRLILLVLVATVAFPAAAAKRMTVIQLEKVLSSDYADHRPDADVARRLGDVELTERLTNLALNRFANSLPLGPRTALALQLLADQSSFLDPPGSELPATGMPDAATQERMMDAARGYVVQIWPRLPNFFVTRSTNRFDDSPVALNPGDWPVRMGLHLVGTSTRQVTYRDGKEVQDAELTPTAGTTPAARNSTGTAQELGLDSWGEFGPEMTVVLTDSARGKITFSHWEQMAAGLVAVYRYEVPKSVSHYAVNYCCVVNAELLENRMTSGGRGGRVQDNANAPVGQSTNQFHVTPAYHGTLAVDPATGAILRITIEAELNKGDPISRAATVVEYGPVTIGDRTDVCPTRSLAFSMEERAFPGQTGKVPILLVNETTFSHYHRLGATMRMVANPPEATAGTTRVAANGASVPVPGPVPGPGATSPAGSGPATDAGATSAGAPGAATAPQPAESAMVAPPAPAPPAPPADPEMSVAEATALPDTPSGSSAPSSDFQLKLISRLVDVGIVAYDKKGHPIKDLKPEDFELFDNGRKQDLRFFSQVGGEGGQATPDPSTQRTFSNRAPDAVVSSAPELGATVILIDEAHIAWADMSNAKQEIIKFLGTVQPDERVGLYTMTALGFKVLHEITTDHAALTAVLQKWMPTARSAALAQEEETRNRQQFDEVHSVSDLNSVNGNQLDVVDGMSTVDPALRTMGSNPGRASLIILQMVARHLSSVTGHKNLVWVSSDNVFADWQSNQVGIDKTPKQTESFAMHAQEAMNDAHVAVFPMDVSQIETSGISADIRTRNVELNQAAADNAGANGGTVPRNESPGRNTAEMQQDIHPIQGPIRMVAEATGGRVIRRASDMAGELTTVVEAGRATYLVSFSPNVPADDQYHTITVKLTGKHPGVTLRYRTGYEYTKEAASLSDRFKDAVWKPQDVREIAVSSTLNQTADGSDVKISIAAADLGLQQQAGLWMDKLDIFFIQRDDAGLKAEVEGQTLGMRLKPASYQKLLSGGIPFDHTVQMKPGMASLRILVVDENSGRMGSITMPRPALTAAAGH
jgi:VWFA-related protein